MSEGTHLHFIGKSLAPLFSHRALQEYPPLHQPNQLFQTAMLGKEKGDGRKEVVLSFPSGSQSNLSFVHVTPPGIEMGEMFLFK